MNKNKLRILLLKFCLAAFSLPFVNVHGAGGRIEGKITDPKGAVVVGAKVTVTDPATNQSFNATTDAEGQYKIEGLSVGDFLVVVSAPGFAEARRENVKVADSAVVTLDFKLEVGAVEAVVTVAAKANTDPVYQQIRQLAKADGDFGGPFATVSNIVLKRDAGIFTLRSGELYFTRPIEGRITAAVFIGDGELSLTPPTPIEKHTLSIFINNESLSEEFSHLVIRFTDATFDEITSSSNAKMGNGGAQAAKARDLYRENQQLLRKDLRDNVDLRTLTDIYAPKRDGYFDAFIDGKRHSKLVFVLDPLGIPEVSPEEVALLSYGESDGGIWTAFHLANEYANRTASSAEDHRQFDITHHEIDGTIKGTLLSVIDRITFKNLIAGTRVVPFELFGPLRVLRAQDTEGNDISFIQEAKDEDSDFAVILPKPLAAGQTYQLLVQYEGTDAIRDSGGGNFILIPRSTWYPGNANTLFAEDRATFDMTFRFPSKYTFVGTGAPVAPDAKEGDLTIAKWSSGQTDLAVAGFNIGRFKKKVVSDKDSGYDVEFYANVEVPDELKAIQHDIEMAESEGINTETTLGSISTTKIADAALADAQNATRIYNAFFGKLPYSRIAMTQQPAGFFGQAWPTLVFMPYLAYVDTTQRAQLLGTRGGTDTFWRYVGPHEVAHQWWGHVIGWDSYRDQWMSEGFAEFSASLYVQFIRGNDKFLAFWEDLRHQIVDATPATKDRKPYTVGPVTQGYRLNSGKTGAVARFMIYPKGAYILHMLRMMMYNPRDGGDKRFQEMMKDFVQTYFNKPVSTENFKSIVEKHMTREMNIDNNGKMDWYFNEWVYGTQVPAYKFEYKVTSDGVLNGKVSQSGVSDDFVMLVPIYVDMGKGWARLGAATIQGNTSVDITGIKLPAVPKRVAVAAMNDVLATSIENSK